MKLKKLKDVKLIEARLGLTAVARKALNSNKKRSKKATLGALLTRFFVYLALRTTAESRNCRPMPSI